MTQNPQALQALGQAAISAPPVAQKSVTGKKSKRFKRIALISILAISILIVLWLNLAIIFGRSSIGGKQVSLATSKSTLEQTMVEQTEAYKMTVSYPDKTEKSFTLKEMGLSLDKEASIKSLQQMRLVELASWWQPKTAELKFTIDQTKFNSFLTNDLSKTIQPATDAKVKIEKGQVVVTDSTAGKRYGLVYPQETINKTTGALSPEPVELQLLALNPPITSQQLESSTAKIKNILSQRIVFTIGGVEKVATSSDIGSWLDLTPDEKQKHIKIDVNSGKVLEHIDRIAKPYIRPGRDQVVVDRDDGSSSTLVTGVNGIDVEGKSEIAVQVTNSLLEAKGIEVDLPINTSPYKTVTAGNYAKWIEVDVTNKQMYAYEKTNLVKSFFISSGAPATPTVLGQYKVQYKLVQQDMRGQNVDGSNYFQPHVPWVLYFFEGYAIHGNYWRPLSWFGRVNSSHGCVGVTVADGEWIYNWAPVGTVIIIHT